ncbi:MAG: Hsp20/alpha crystallin family protein [archaeon]
MVKDFRDEMRRMHRKFNHWFKNFDENPWDFEEEDFSQYRKAWVDAREMENEFVIAVELPGFEKEDIEVNAEDGMLTIKVEKKSEKKKEKDESYSYQSSYSGFFRRIPLPENADAENIDAEYKSGVLKLRIPKKAKTKKGKTIKIK